MIVGDGPAGPLNRSWPAASVTGPRRPVWRIQPWSCHRCRGRDRPLAWSWVEHIRMAHRVKPLQQVEACMSGTAVPLLEAGCLPRSNSHPFGHFRRSWLSFWAVPVGHCLSGMVAGGRAPPQDQLPLGLLEAAVRKVVAVPSACSSFQPFSPACCMSMVMPVAYSSHIGRIVLGGSRITTGAQDQGHTAESKRTRFFQREPSLGREVYLYPAAEKSLLDFVNVGEKSPEPGGRGGNCDTVLKK